MLSTTQPGFKREKSYLSVPKPKSPESDRTTKAEELIALAGTPSPRAGGETYSIWRIGCGAVVGCRVTHEVAILFNIRGSPRRATNWQPGNSSRWFPKEITSDTGASAVPESRGSRR